ncbi:uncharacterized protein LOC142986530 [Anticarsia gemmatalis]|uniref:uncharacterized protein LOC142986530 n=1 Tax=Anticarsia gemmatalis TaxID=129554 RepID=UPI003F76CEA0
MERVTTFLIINVTIFLAQCFPIENGFTLKLNPISQREDLKPKDLGKLFAKVPQDGKKGDKNQKDVFNKVFFPRSFDLGAGHTNQVAKLLAPGHLGTDYNVTKMYSMNFLNLPMIKQPFTDYKVIVAAAPPNVNLASSDEMKKTVVYIVFPDDGSKDQEVSVMPKVYFVNENSIQLKNLRDQAMIDPILVIDSNRTVTGLKSKEIAKFLRFSNKLTKRFNYEITR